MKINSLISGGWALVLSLAWALASAQTRMQKPPPGPAAQADKQVVFIASDFKNGGVMGVYRGFEEAAQKLGWHIRLEDGRSQKATQAALLTQVLAARPHGIVFGGFEPNDFAEQVARAKQDKVALLGWHAAREPGATKELFVNVSTRPVDVARMAAEFVIRDAIDSKRQVGVVIFNDRQYAVANAKTEAMQQTIRACQGYTGCRLLAVENVPIAEAAVTMPSVVPKLIAAHGAAWTYSLAINDVYFDAINYPLMQAKRGDILNVSAGDGSNKALSRIGAGVSQQVATVAEPLKMQGYQLADELNRALAASPPSGFQSQPILVTPALLKATGNRGIESNLGFEAAYAAIWAGK
jgi:ribose transport system substrate-binding protein